MRVLTLIAGFAVLLAVFGVQLVEEGEVAMLTTTDARGRASKTGLWIVEIDGKTYVRACSSEADWLERARAQPECEFARGGETRRVRVTAIHDAALKEDVGRAMREKYGLIDAVFVRLVDPSESVPVLVETLAPTPPRGRGATSPAGDSP